MTQLDRSGMTCTLFPVQVSQMISLPSKEPVTQCLLSPEKCTEFTLLMCPLRNFLVEILSLGASPRSAHFSWSLQSATFACSAWSRGAKRVIISVMDIPLGSESHLKLLNEIIELLLQIGHLLIVFDHFTRVVLLLVTSERILLLGEMCQRFQSPIYWT